MFLYEDLLTVPFKLGGRDKNGLDCYGLVLELCSRAGTPLKDLRAVNVSNDEFNTKVHEVNLTEINEAQAKAGDVVQCIYNNEIHIGYLLTKSKVIHATTAGVRVSPVLSLHNRKYFKVEANK